MSKKTKDHLALFAVAVNDGKIIAEVEQGLTPEVYLEDITGCTALIIAGESADFTFTLDKDDYDGYAHS